MEHFREFLRDVPHCSIVAKIARRAAILVEKTILGVTNEAQYALPRRTETLPIFSWVVRVPASFTSWRGPFR